MLFPALFSRTTAMLAGVFCFSVWPSPAAPWTMGAPIVSYWAGPGFPGGAAMTDAAASRLSEGGYNLVWCHEAELAVAEKHGLRGLLTDPLLVPGTLDDPTRRKALDALVARVKNHPGLYSYHLVDEPAAQAFPALGRLVAYLREKDPAHTAYINLLPTYASNAQLGTPGDKLEAYTSHLRQYVETVRPDFLSYDHYQFTRSGDNPDYFLNLALVRDQAKASGMPFMNIVQASSWVPTSLASPHSPRVPDGDEMRFLVYSTLAYGAQAISYYVYCYPGHEGGMENPDGSPTPLYGALKALNRDFLAIATELQPLQSLGVFHAGMTLPGTVPLPVSYPFSFNPAIPSEPFESGMRAKCVVLGCFGPRESPASATASHFVIVNTDYKAERTVTLSGPTELEVFDPVKKVWSPLPANKTGLRLEAGGGRLLRTVK